MLRIITAIQSDVILLIIATTKLQINKRWLHIIIWLMLDKHRCFVEKQITRMTCNDNISFNQYVEYLILRIIKM